jgi:hypothetical protein
MQNQADNHILPPLPQEQNQMQNLISQNQHHKKKNSGFINNM